MLDPTAVEGLSEVSCSPLKVVEGGSRTTTPSAAVLMVLTHDTTIMHLPPVPGGMPAAVMAVPMAWILAPFDGAGPSQRGRKGILKSEENNLYRNLGSIPIVLAPFLWIPLFFWYGNLT
jgi:hypothetical protein